MKKLIIPIIFILLMLPSVCMSDEEALPYAYVKTDYWGKYYFKMLPGEKRFDYDNYGSGALYEVSADGSNKLLWTTRGWYAFQVYISPDGMYLVRLGNWPRAYKPSKDHLAIAFYKNGKLIKSYSTLDLIKDLSAVRPSVSHYSYYKKIIGFIGDISYRFSLITIDNIEYIFDISNGGIVSQKNIESPSK